MVTISPPIQIGDATWKIPFSSNLGSPTFYVYVDGVLVSKQTATSYTLRVESGSVPIIEVLDSPTAKPQAFPNYMALGWNGDVNAAQYKIEQQQADFSWLAIKTIPGDVRKAWFTFYTGVLADEAIANWRVTPIDSYGNLGTAVVFTALMVRHPDIPAPTVSYSNSTQKVTLS